MANHNPLFFYTALILTLLAHLAMIGPVADWLSNVNLPRFSDETIQIDLADKQSQEIPPQAQPEAPPEPKPPEPLPPEKSGKETLLNPDAQKQLDPDLKEDRISDAPQPKAPPLRKQARKVETKPQQQETQAAEKKVTENQPADRKEQRKEAKETEKATEAEETEEIPVSPMFVEKPEKTEKEAEDAPSPPAVPKEIEETFREGRPEPTEDENLEFSLNSYQWTFRRFMENWAYDIQKWWKAPLDYAMGNVPEGGDMWIQVKLSKSGRLLGYRIVDSTVTPEMELRVIQALVGSLSRPPIPNSFSKTSLIVNWHFIYPPIRPEIDMRR